MNYLSVCSGIEAASVAWHPLGWSPWAFAEVEAFPSAVLAHHYPTVPNLGDLTRFKEWPNAAIDVLVGGTPCQSFSVAGLRAGLDDPRGGLLLTYLAIARRYRPRWVVWENVPGVLSIDDGRAFGSLLGGLEELGYGVAYRVLNAKHFGVPQRRRRVFVVGHLGDWRRAAAVLFERASLSGHPAPRREEGQIAPTVPSRRTGGGGLGTDFDCDGGLIAGTLLSGGEKGNNPLDETLLPMPILDGAKGRTCDRGSRDSHDIGSPGDPMFTLRGGGHALAFGGNNTSGPIDVATAVNAHGGPCGRMDFESETFIAHAFDARQSDTIQYGDRSGPLDTDGHTIGLLHNTLYNQGISHASTQKTHAGTLLRALSEAVGAEAFTQWGLGILNSLLPPEVLRSRLHGRSLRLAADFSRRWLVYHALARPEAHSEGIVQAMREAEREGRASQGWRPSEQLARELGAYLSELSQPGAQAARFMRDLWQASEGLGLLRQALSAVQEVGRPARGEGQPVRAVASRDAEESEQDVCGDGLPEATRGEGLLRDARATSQARQVLAVRRLTVEECEFLQGFPRGYTAIPYRGKPAADGPRYKALGNSMAVPVMHWIGRRIQMVDDLTRALEATA